jgi:hypothetical protein
VAVARVVVRAWAVAVAVVVAVEKTSIFDAKRMTLYR